MSWAGKWDSRDQAGPELSTVEEEVERFRVQSGGETFITWVFWFDMVLLYSVTSYGYLWS